jgi:UDP-N-acetylmuramate dehydrogenase
MSDSIMLTERSSLNRLQNLRGRLLPNEPLAAYTSWRVGGPADYVYIPADIEDLVNFLKQLPAEIPLLWLGLGSNTLVRDGGIDGVAIVTQGALNGITSIDSLTVTAEAGVSCAQLARYTARLGLTGLEFMAGIPGTIGGALAMNAGCYGGETWQWVSQVETIHRSGRRQLRGSGDFEVAYRHVVRPADEWFVAGHFKLLPGEKARSLEDIRQLLEKRNMSQPTSWPNGGSVFRNPPGQYAARLIEQSGLKGFAQGNARVSDKHANFIINEGNALAADIESLILQVAKQVEQQQGVCLIPEVCMIGKSV